MLYLLSVQHSRALNIALINISNISENVINVSLNTEAVELYYFQSWRYSFSGTTIVLEARFVPGFGSTIAYLNNNFEIPLNTIQPATYQLIVKAYYTFLKNDCLQDSCEAVFSTPLPSRILVIEDFVDTQDTREVLFANPSDGTLWVDPQIAGICIFDMAGTTVVNFRNTNGKISLSNVADGMYLISYFWHQQCKTVKLILKKR